MGVSKSVLDLYNRSKLWTPMTSTTAKYWLLKAEPDSRIVKGKDVKFSVYDFEKVKTSPWEGVRNYEARNLMKEMKEGDEALFYHSNCKIPGIAAFAQVTKQAYPDYTAWDSSHPYYDPKSDSKDPRWFMVDLTFVSRAPHFVPLALLRKISELPHSRLPAEIAYLSEEDILAIKAMDLVTRGRLSVQRVQESAWLAIQKLAKAGGWEDLDLSPEKKGKGNATISDAAQLKEAKRTANSKISVKESRKRVTQNAAKEDEDEDDQLQGLPARKSLSKRKRGPDAGESEEPGLRRSTRVKK